MKGLPLPSPALSFDGFCVGIIGPDEMISTDEFKSCRYLRLVHPIMVVIIHGSASARKGVMYFSIFVGNSLHKNATVPTWTWMYSAVYRRTPDTVLYCALLFIGYAIYGTHTLHMSVRCQPVNRFLKSIQHTGIGKNGIELLHCCRWDVLDMRT